MPRGHQIKTSLSPSVPLFFGLNVRLNNVTFSASFHKAFVKDFGLKIYELLNTVWCYSLKDCTSTAHISPASLGLTCGPLFAEFPWSTADGKVMFVFLFNCSLICRWTGDQISNVHHQNLYWCLANLQFVLCASSVWYSSYLAVPRTMKNENQDSLKQILISVLHFL